MKYKKIKNKSDRGKLIDKTLTLIREILIIERGPYDELNSKPAKGLGLFHILGKGSHPRLTIYKPNLILVNWMPLHFWHHHDPEKDKKFVEPLLIKRLGEHYRDELLAAEACQPILNMVEIQMQLEVRKLELKDLQ